MPLSFGPRSLYVYYRVTPAQLAAGLLQHVQALQATVCQAHPGMQAQLMARTDNGTDASPTWMEVYTHPQGVSAEAEETLARVLSTWPAHLACSRHAESFASVCPSSPLD